jgi:hypothetical protein
VNVFCEACSKDVALEGLDRHIDTKAHRRAMVALDDSRKSRTIQITLIVDDARQERAVIDAFANARRGINSLINDAYRRGRQEDITHMGSLRESRDVIDALASPANRRIIR